MDSVGGPVILDMEASLEHMSRATVKHVDTLLVVTEPYYRSLESARRLIRLAREIPIPRIVALANKVRSADEEQAVKAYLETQDVALVGVIPYDDAVRDADAQGRPLLDVAPDSPAVAALRLVSAELFSV